jgi:O-succinylbenzoic acid--CoA ligase
VTDFLAEALASHPDAFAVGDGTRRWSFLELDRAVRERERVLRGHGTGPGHTVVLEVDLSLESLASLHAAFRSGALVAPLSPELAPLERAAALEALRPTLVISGDDLAPLEGGPRRADPCLPTQLRLGGDEPIAVLWTSGTSGQPRGVLLSERGFRASTEGARRRLDLRGTDVWYAALQPAHVGGLALLLRAAMLGCGLEVRGRFSVDEFGELLEDGTATHASLVPTMLRRLLDARAGRSAPPGLRCLLLGGSHTPDDLLARAIAAGYPIALTYGLTEATSQVATAPPTLVRSKPGTVGRPLHGVEVRIGPDGRIHVRGPTVAAGLLDGGTLVDADGWLPTEDLGHLDAEGHLRIVGRGSDRIISGGVNVDPHEVEAALRRHPRVEDACVVGLPDESWGERVAALVIAAERPDVDAGGSATGPAATGRTEDVLLEWMRGEVSAAKRPRSLLVVDRLPLNANGKVDRAAVRALLTSPRGPLAPGRG